MEDKTMKKTYKTPTITVEKLETIQMLAASVTMFGQDATEAAMGRQGFIFDNEDELGLFNE
jgi:hypothetical protein